jgi:hypothetical protein
MEAQPREGVKGWIMEGGIEEVLRASSHANVRKSDSSQKAGDGSFQACKSFEAADNLARYGWTEGRTSIEAVVTSVGLGSYARVQEFVPDVSGAVVDVAAAIAGVPESMLEFVEVDKRGAGKLIRLVVNCVAHAGIHADTLKRRGAAVLALVDALESAGLVAEVDIVFFEHSTGDHVTVVHVKRAGETFDPDRLAYAVAHPDFFRRHIFATWERQAPQVRKELGVEGGSYGYPKDAEDVGFEIAEGDIYLPRVQDNGGDWANEKTVKAWVLQQLAEQGVEAEAV